MKLLYILLFLSLSSLTFAQQARMVVDLSPGAASTFGTNDHFEDNLQITFNNKVLFLKRNSNTDKEVWVSDGTAAGTQKIFGYTYEYAYWDFENSNPEKLFYIFKDENKYTLASLDKNTLDTTVIMTSTKYMGDLNWYKGAYYFNHDTDLWKYDITQNKVELVYDFVSFIGLRSIGILDSQLIMIARADDGTNLFKSDGTTAGTSKYLLLNDGNEFSDEEYFTQVGDLLLFFYYTPSDSKYRLYATDGTAAGTEAIIALKKPSFTNLYEKRRIISWQNKLYFSGTPEGQGNNREELYVSDGTVAGTFLIDTDDSPDDPGRPQYFTPYNGKLYFAGDWNSWWNLKIYKTDGTQVGTSPVVFDAIQSGGYQGVDVFRDSLCFDVYGSNTGHEIAFSKGTENSTRILDFIPGDGSVSANSLMATDRYLFFIGKTADTGRELWVYDPDSIIISNTNISQIPLEIFPNPCIDKISFSQTRDFSINDKVFIYGMDGKAILKRSFEKEINISALKPGIYKVVIYTKTGIYSSIFRKE